MRELKKRVLSVGMAIFFILGAFVGCGGAEEKEKSEVAKGYQWKVQKDGKELYLIGTMHPINDEYNYFSDTVLDIIEKTDVLSLEVNASEQDALLANARIMYEGGKTIEDDLNKKEIEALKLLAKDTGLDYEKLKVYKAQGIVQNISAVTYEKANLDMKTFDDMLKERYLKENKKVDQVENMEFQIELLDKIQGIDTLKEMLDGYKEGSFEELSKEDVEYAKNIMEAYKTGDEAFMLEAIKMQKENEETYKSLILDRNIDMVKKIEEYMKLDEKYVVAVGALHFFGDDGIVELLKQKGYSVEKL
ncbi:MAG: TraB/GumN family protein [Clostridium sp.]|uniref:TraB/GumN family protein n=1 Tax=Clostridium sp. TaxID=1506 RepID=UPI003F36DBA6